MLHGHENPSQSPKTPISYVDIALGLVIDRQGTSPRVLVTRRPDHVDLAGLWELPGGKIADGESPEAAARREVCEETGLAADTVDTWPVIEHVYAHRAVRLRPVLCRYLGGAVKHLEVADHRWVGATELASLDWPAANAPLIERLAKHLQG